MYSLAGKLAHLIPVSELTVRMCLGGTWSSNAQQIETTDYLLRKGTLACVEDDTKRPRNY